jgi:hypothetical protein
MKMIHLKKEEEEEEEEDKSCISSRAFFCFKN